jgi:hypothetical protein
MKNVLKFEEFDNNVEVNEKETLKKIKEFFWFDKDELSHQDIIDDLKSNRRHPNKSTSISNDVKDDLEWAKDKAQSYIRSGKLSQAIYDKAKEANFDVNNSDVYLFVDQMMKIKNSLRNKHNVNQKQVDYDKYNRHH